MSSARTHTSTEQQTGRHFLGAVTPGDRPRSGVRAAVLALSLAAVGVLGTGVPSAQAAPVQGQAVHQGPAVECRGQGVDPDARIRYGSDIVIDAPLHTIWKVQTDVQHWPSWQAPVLTMERLGHGPLRPGAQFRWTTPAPATPTTPETTLAITSTVRQLKANSCIRWTGPAIGDGLRIDEGVHVWTFSKVKDGVRVRTEETWTGDQVETDVPTATAALGQGLELWLSDLKTTAEAAAHR
ncbi:SRPBCC family protein [Streptomyces sp. NPDC006012]|uniref:SRPBCC family protein n=1 Tax=Streptomyces sp. NPDC006012 TaxID=3364739 RepID=UPI00368E8D51